MRWILLIAITAALLYYFMNMAAPPPKPVATAPQSASVPAPENAAAPATPAQAPAPAATPNVAASVIPRLQAAARQTGVTLRDFRMQPGGAWVYISWPGGNATLGGDFLEACMNQGIIRDFDMNNKKEGMGVENGVQMFTAQYLVYLN